jgi:hypothetical protein
MFLETEDGGKEWYSILHELLSKRTKIRLILAAPLEDLLRLGPRGKVTLYSLAALSVSPDMEIFTVSDREELDFQACVHLGKEIYIIRWQGKSIFAENNEITLSVLDTYTMKVKDTLQKFVEGNDARRWDLQKIERLLQGTEVIKIEKDSNLSWKDILLPHIPESILEIEIYDRFIRNMYQFKSLEMFIEALIERKSSEILKIKIITTSDTSAGPISDQFMQMQKKYEKRGVEIEYRIFESNKELPHYRKVFIKSLKGNYSIWLDRGLNIFHFKNHKDLKFATLESYIVVERMGT